MKHDIVSLTDITAKAKELFLAGEDKASEVFCMLILENDPDNADARHILGMIAYRQERYDAAITLLAEAIRIDPSNARYFNNAGCVYAAVNDAEKAITCFTKSVKIEPDFINAYVNLGNSYLRSQQLDKARKCFEKALEIRPDMIDVLMQLGRMTADQGQSQEALDYYRRALEITPENASLLEAVAKTCEKLQKYHEAIDYYERAIMLGAASVASYNNLGFLYHGQRLFDKALACFRHILEHEPHNSIAEYMAASITGALKDIAPGTYVERLFDDFARNFEEVLLNKLDYQSHRLLAGEIITLAGSVKTRLDILDLGCGTGLVGSELSGVAGRLVGVDLSGNMIQEAARKKVYTRLVQSDILTMIQQEPDASYDVLIAADTFIYVGDLSAITREARRLLRDEGIFAFSVESIDNNKRHLQMTHCDYMLNISCRYSHSYPYLENLAKISGFRECVCKLATARTERGESIKSWHLLWKKLSVKGPELI